MPGDRPPADGAGAAAAAWQATFADLAALLLSFFVLMFSMSVMEEQRWAALSAGLVERRHPGERTPAPPPLWPLTAPQEDGTAATSADYLHALLRRRLDQAPLLAPVALTRTPDGVVIRFDAGLVLRGDRPAPTAQGASLIGRLAILLTRLDNAVDLRLQPPAAADAGQNDRAAWLRAATAVAGLLRAAGFERPLAAHVAGATTASAAATVEIIVHGYRA